MVHCGTNSCWILIIFSKKVESRRGGQNSRKAESLGRKSVGRQGRESSPMRRSKGWKIRRFFVGSSIRSTRRETEDKRKSDEREGGCERNFARTNDLHSKKTRRSESAGKLVAHTRDNIPEGDLRLKITNRSRDAREENTPPRDLRHKIKRQSSLKKEVAHFEGLSHGIVEGGHLRQKIYTQEKLRNVGREFVYLRDKTCTVDTADIEEHFSKDREVEKVKFIGKQRGANMFKVMVTAAWQINQMRSFHTIRGVELEVESKIWREYSCTNSNLSRDGQNLNKSRSRSGGSSDWFGSLQRKPEGSHGRERDGWWETHFVMQGGTEDWEVKEGNAVKKGHQQRSDTRDLQDGQLGLARLVVDNGTPCIRERLSKGKILLQQYMFIGTGIYGDRKLVRQESTALFCGATSP